MDTWTTGPVALLDDAREAADARLQAAVGAGHLSLDDYERRLSILLADHSTIADVAAVTSDLPVLPTVSGAEHPQDQGPRRNRFVAVALASALVGGGLLGIAALPDDPPMPEAIVVVPEGTAQFDIGRHSGTLVVVVPDGVLALTDEVEAAGDLYCVDACAWPSGPTVGLRGAGLSDVLVKTQSEMETGTKLDIIVG